MSPDDPEPTFRQPIIPLAGDIVLLLNSGGKSRAISKAQRVGRLFRRSGREYSHAALCLLNGTFVHSTLKGGVHIIGFVDLVANAKNWLAMRHKRLASQAGSVSITDKCRFFLAQNYNFSFGAFPTQSTQRSFCSELVAKVYEMLELPLFDKPPRKIWPVDLQHLLATPDWEDVTNLYQSKAVGKLLASEDQRKETEYMRVQSENLRIQMTTHVQEYKAIKALLAAGGRLDEMLGLPKKGTAGKLPIDLPIKFWDTPPIE